MSHADGEVSPGADSVCGYDQILSGDIFRRSSSAAFIPRTKSTGATGQRHHQEDKEPETYDTSGPEKRLNTLQRLLAQIPIGIAGGSENGVRYNAKDKNVGLEMDALRYRLGQKLNPRGAQMNTPCMASFCSQAGQDQLGPAASSTALTRADSMHKRPNLAITAAENLLSRQNSTLLLSRSGSSCLDSASNNGVRIVHNRSTFRRSTSHASSHSRETKGSAFEQRNPACCDKQMIIVRDRRFSLWRNENHHEANSVEQCRGIQYKPKRLRRWSETASSFLSGRVIAHTL
jgi:hypothetical protein